MLTISIVMLVLLFMAAQGWQAVAPARLSLQRPDFGYGANVADLKNAPRLREMGFQWMKGFVGWDSLEPKPDEYDWTNLSKAAVTARQNSLGLLLRVDRVPAWARPDNPDLTAPPARPFLAAWGDFLEDLARRGRGHVAAYEIWNEPNLSWEWGGQSPDPAYYVEMLRIAYQRIKAGDPGALVVSAGLAPTQGDGERGAMDNLRYLRMMYERGAASYFDVLGSHAYGFASPPDADPHTFASFRSPELEREVMLEFGDGAKAVWATEAGWLLKPGNVGLSECEESPALHDTLWQAVDQEVQARYLADAYRYAYVNWPWMGAIFLFNLDFSVAPWYSNPCEPMTFYSLLGPDGKPRAGFEALREMPKAGGGP
ncbi:MAG: beta-galactosidase [Dehalococcoidia bacterium]|nr:beta-galactosidase [Dehalococcoidia bacterium]